jgi:hypothetical protein
MKIHVTVTAAALSLLLAYSSSVTALDLSGQSRTYLHSRETTDSSRLLPFFEYLDFRAEDIGSKNVSFHFGGWLRHDLREESAGNTRANSDLQYAYLRVRGEKTDADMDLGRVLVNEGVASEQMDGAYVRAALWGGFGVAAFGGSPVETTFDDRSGDSVYGGRISHSVQNIYRVGFSYLEEKNSKDDFRKEEGIDLWLRPFSKIELLGNSFYNSLTSAWMLHSYYLTFGPFAGLRLSALGTEVSYGDYFTSGTTSAFKFDPAIIDPKEKLSTTGGEAAYTFGGPITISADYKQHSYDIAGDADYFGGKLAYSSPGSVGFGIAWHRMDGVTDKLRYDEYRAYVSGKFGKLNLTADYFIVRYETPIDGIKDAYAAVLAGGFDFTKGVRLAADVEYARNPFYKEDVRGLVKLVYDFESAAPAAKGRKGK